MQPVSASTVQITTTPAPQKKATGQPHPPVTITKNSNRGEMTLPEDVVNLSTSSRTGHPASKTSKASTPVSSEEKDALLKASSGNMSFSLYA